MDAVANIGLPGLFIFSLEAARDAVLEGFTELSPSDRLAALQVVDKLEADVAYWMERQKASGGSTHGG